jgi:hypothetical protein
MSAFSPACKKQRVDSDEARELTSSIKWFAASGSNSWMKTSIVMTDSFDEDFMGSEAKTHQIVGMYEKTCQHVAVNIRIHSQGLEERLKLPKDLNYKRAEEEEKYVSFRVINQQLQLSAIRPFPTAYNSFSYCGLLPMKLSDEALSDHTKLPWETWMLLVERTMPFGEAMLWRLI